MVQHDVTNSQTATIAVVNAISAASETEPTALPPLYDAINPDALNALFESHDSHPDRSELRVEFSYNGFSVVVRDGPQVTVREDEPTSG